MIFFRVTQNINIKTTDGTLVKYLKFKIPSDLNNETVYITTHDDFEELKQVFKSVDKVKYSTRLLVERKIRELEDFPIELGISNSNEYLSFVEYEKTKHNYFINQKEEVDTFLHSSTKVDIYKQLTVKKHEISIGIIGGVGKTIGEMVASSTALRILYDILKEVYTTVNMDLYINASNNSFYSRDKDIYKKQSFIKNIYPLSISSKKLCEYDYFIDNSTVSDKSPFYKELNFIDAWLYKFGIDYLKVPSSLKYNKLDLSKYKPSDSLRKKIFNAKKKGKLLLFHPYSANIEKSIPQEYAISMLKKLIEKADDYTIVTTLNVDGKKREHDIVDFSKESKSFNDFAYIISNMDAIITAQTATFHLADSFMIPTVVIFTNSDYERRIKYYNFVKAIEIKDKSKNLSKFIYENDDLTIYKFLSWEKLKVDRIIKLLETL